MPSNTVPTIKKSPSLPTILIAGGAGFLGSHLAEKLLETQCRVVAVDNLATGRRSFIQSLIPHPRFVFIDADINQGIPKEIESVNYIFHLAALEVYLTGRKDVSFDSLLTNALGTRHLLSLAKKSKAKFLLASSIEVYRGLLSSENLEHYFGASFSQQRRFAHAEAKRFAEALTWEFFERGKVDARIARLGEIYGPRMDLKSSGTLGRLLEELLSGKDLTVYGEGLEKEYYTHVNDVVAGLIRALLGEDTVGKIFPLTTLEPTTPLELVYLLKELVGENIRVIFKPPLEETKLPELNVLDGEILHELSWQPQISLKEGIDEILRETKLKPQKEAPEPKKEPSQPKLEAVPVKALMAKIKKRPEVKKKPAPKLALPKPGRRLARLGFLVLAAALTWWLFFPAASLAVNLYGGQRNLQQFAESAKNLEFEKAATQAERARTQLLTGSRQLSRLGWFFSLFRKERPHKSWQNLLQSGVFFAESLQHEVTGIQPLAQGVLNLFATTPQEFDSAKLPSSVAEFTEAQESLLLTEAYLKKVEADAIPSRFKPLLVQLQQQTQRLKNDTPLLKQLAANLPTLLGSDQPQTYLLLFQNSNELRPTGGFIGSYGKLVLNEGQIDELLVDDVYNLDGLLETKDVQIEPPPPLKDHLGVDRFLLRDANWDPDFTKAAEQIKNFYLLATEEEVDGIIALDLRTLQKFLEISGPVYLAQFNESITAENFFEKTEFYAEAGYFSGSPQKKTFLSLLSAKLLEKLMQLSAQDLTKLFSTTKSLLDEKHLLIYYPKGDMAKLLSLQNWDGHLLPAENDYLMIVDANVGATKANYYVKRSLSYSLKNVDREGKWEATLTINYIHGAASNAWPGGAYKDYVRVFVPEGSVLKKVVRSSEGVDSKDLEITTEVNQGVIDDKNVWGTVFTLNAGKTLSLSFTYELPEGLSLGPDGKSYTLRVQKQPGTVADPLMVDLLTPFGRTVVQAPEGSKRVGNLWRYSGSLRKDLELRFLIE